MKYKKVYFNYINTLGRKRKEQLVIIKSNILKSKADKGIRSPVAWVLGKYAMHCDAMLVWSAVLIGL